MAAAERVVEVMEIAPGLFAAALFRRTEDWRGREIWRYVAHAGGHSPTAALLALDPPLSATVVHNLARNQ
jgi:hypothetical protein